MDWNQITKNPAYSNLTPDRQAKVKEAFFRAKILPRIEESPKLKEMGRDKIFQAWMASPDDTGQGAFTSGLSSVGRGALSVIPGVVGGAGYLTDSEELQQAGEDIQQGINRALPVNPVLEDTFGMKALNAVGQAGSMMITGGAGGALGKVLAGTKAVAGGAEAAVLSSAALQGAQQGGQLAKQYGLEGGDKAAMIGMHAILDPLTEKLPFGVAVETGLAQQLFKAPASKLLTASLKPSTAIVSEGVEEAASQIGSNLTQKALAPEGAQTPGLLEGAGESFALGAVGGATFAGVNAMAGRSPQQGTTTPPASTPLKYNEVTGKLVRPFEPAKMEPVKTTRNGRLYHRDENGAWSVVVPPATPDSPPIRVLDAIDPQESRLITELDDDIKRAEAKQKKVTPVAAAPEPVVEKPVPVQVDPSALVVPPEKMAEAQKAAVEGGPAWAQSVDLSEPIGVYQTPSGNEVFDGAKRVLAALMTGRTVTISPQPQVIPTEEQNAAVTSQGQPDSHKYAQAAATAATKDGIPVTEIKPGNVVTFNDDTGKPVKGVVENPADESGNLIINTPEGDSVTKPAQDVESVPPEAQSPSRGDIHTAVKIGGRITTTPDLHYHAVMEYIRRNELPAHQRNEYDWRDKADAWLVKAGPEWIRNNVKEGFVIGGQFMDRQQAFKHLKQTGVETPLADREKRNWLDSADIKGYDLRTPAEVLATQENNERHLFNLGLFSKPGERGWSTVQLKTAMWRISNDESMPQTIRTIAEILSKLPFSDVILNIKADATLDFAGLYEPIANDGTNMNSRGEIVVNTRGNGRGEFDVRYTLVHELLHHVTTWKIHTGTSLFDKQQVENLSRLLKRARAYAASQETGDNGPARRFDYELSNVDEFIAGLFTRADFQQFLASIPLEYTPPLVGRIRTILQELFRTIGRLVTGSEIEPGSLLDESFGATLNLIHSDSLAVSMPGALMNPSSDVAARDAEYMAAVESGDVAKQQAMVDAAAKASGYETEAWHSTRSKDKITTFNTRSKSMNSLGLLGEMEVTREAAFFTVDEGFANAFGGSVNKYFLNTDEVYDATKYVQERSIRERFMDWLGPNVPSKDPESGLNLSDKAKYAHHLWQFFDGELGEKFREFLTEEGITGVEFEESTEDAKTGDDVEGTTIAVFNPNQIKSADPVTRDADGNVIPLSQRFNQTTPDIRYNPSRDYRFAALEREQEFKARNADGSLQKLRDQWEYVQSAEEGRTVNGENVPALSYVPRRDEAMEAAVMDVLDDLQLSNASGDDLLRIITAGIQPGSNVPLTADQRAIFARWLLRSGRHVEFGLSEEQVLKAFQSLASEFGYIGREWQQVLDPITKLKKESDTKTKTTIKTVTTEDADTIFHDMQEEIKKLTRQVKAAREQLKAQIGGGINSDVKKTDVEKAEKALESFRTLMARDGAKSIVDAVFGESSAATIEQTGPLVTGADTIKKELRSILGDVLERMGITKPQQGKVDEYQRIAVALGLDDVRSDKLAAADKLLRDRIAERIEADPDFESEAADILDLWETASASMRSNSVSGATARRVFKQTLKEQQVSVGDLASMQPRQRARAISSLADIIVGRVKAAGSTQDLSNLKKVMTAAAEQMVAARLDQQARADAIRNDQQNVAEAVIEQFERKFSDVPNLQNRDKTGIRKLVDDAIHAREIMPDFVERAMALGVDELTARTLGDMTMEHGRRKAEEREERERKAEAERRQNAIKTVMNRLTAKAKESDKPKMGKFLGNLLKADELGILDSQMFTDAFAGAFDLNNLTPAIVRQLRETWRSITAVDASGKPINRGMVRETMERQFMEAVNAVSPGARFDNMIFDQYQAAALASVSSIINQFSGVFRVLFGVDAFARSFARGDVLGTAQEWWKGTSELFSNLPLILTGIRGESLGFAQPALKTTFKSGEQKLALTGEGQTFRIQHRDGSVTTLGDTTKKILRLKELWTWRTIRGAEALSGVTDSQARFRDVLISHYTSTGMSMADAKARAFADISSTTEERAAAMERARAEQASGLIGTGDTVLKHRVREIISENIEDRLGADLLSRVEYLTAAAQFKTVPTGVLGFPIYNMFHALAKSDNPLAKGARFFFLFGRFLGHTVDTMMAFTPVLSWLTNAREGSPSQRTKIIREVYGTVEMYNKQQHGKHAAGAAFMVMNGMLLALAHALADDDDEPFYQVFGMAPLASRDQKEALAATGRWKEGVLRIFGIDIAYSQIPELGPLLAAIGNASDYARFSGQLYTKDGKTRPVTDAAFYGMQDVLASPIKRSTYKQWVEAFGSMMSGRPTDAFANLATQPIGTALRLPLVTDADKIFRELEGSKDAKGYGENLARRIPFVHVGEAMFNSYGEQLPSLGTISMFPPDGKVSPEVKQAAMVNVETGTVRSLPKDLKVKVSDDEERELTQDERTAFVTTAGRYYVESLLRNEQAVRRAFESGGRDAAQKIINNISSKANKRAKKELGLD